MRSGNEEDENPAMDEERGVQRKEKKKSVFSWMTAPIGQKWEPGVVVCSDCSEAIQQRVHPDAAHKVKQSKSSKYMTWSPGLEAAGGRVKEMARLGGRERISVGKELNVITI